MKKITILLLCCGVLVSMVGCGGNAASPTESPPSTVSEVIMTETPPTRAVEPTEKEKESVSTESKCQVAEPTVTATEPTKTVEPTEEAKMSVTSTAEEKVTYSIEETVPSTTPQLTDSETRATEPTKETAAQTDTSQSEFDIQYWISFAKEYAVSVGLTLDSTAVDCWDNPISANGQCIYLERDIESRLNRYEKDEDITDVWIWAEPIDNDCYDIYISYA